LSRLPFAFCCVYLLVIGPQFAFAAFAPRCSDAFLVSGPRANEFNFTDLELEFPIRSVRGGSSEFLEIYRQLDLAGIRILNRKLVTEISTSDPSSLPSEFRVPVKVRVVTEAQRSLVDRMIESGRGLVRLETRGFDFKSSMLRQRLLGYLDQKKIDRDAIRLLDWFNQRRQPKLTLVITVPLRRNEAVKDLCERLRSHGIRILTSGWFNGQKGRYAAQAIVVTLTEPDQIQGIFAELASGTEIRVTGAD